MDWIKTLLEQQPLMTLFLTIAIGYLVGEINIKGFSLGVGAVLFVALAIGWFAPKSVPAPMVGTLGLALFLYAVGVQYGKQFVIGLTSAAGRRANIIALIGVMAAGAASLLIAKVMGMDLGYALGLFAGSGTSTPTLQAAIATLGNDDPAVGYSVSYPFGVAGPILFLYFAFMILKPKIDTSAGGGMEMLEIAIRNPNHFGRTLGEVMSELPPETKIVGGAHRAPQRAGLAWAHRRRERCRAGRRPQQGNARTGQAKPGRSRARRCVQGPQRPRLHSRVRIEGQRRGPAASATSSCRASGAWSSPRSAAATPTSCRAPTSLLEFGDRVGMLAHRDDFPALKKILRRLDQGHRGVQLHLHRPGHGARLPAGRDPVPAARHRQALGGPGRRPDHGADPRQHAALGRHELDHPAVSQPRAAQPRAHALPGAGRDGLGAEVRRHRHAKRPADACSWVRSCWPPWSCRSSFSGCWCSGCPTTRWRVSSRAPAAIRRSWPIRTRSCRRIGPTSATR